MTSANKPDIRAYVGSTGSGKGVSVERYLKAQKPDRLVVWDPIGEWVSLGREVKDLAGLARAMKAPKFKLVYRPGDDFKAYPGKFAEFCQMVYAAACLGQLSGLRTTVLVEELADVTQPSFAPPSWGRCCTSGRHQGLQIIACTQSPAFVDKKFLGNCTYIRCFTLREAPHRKRMAQALDVPETQMAALQTVEDDRGVSITYYERDFRSGEAGQDTIRLTRR